MATAFEATFEALDRAGVRFVVVGGVAVVLHGHARLTMDLDLILDLTPSSASAAMETLTSLGLIPSVPVPAQDFADPDKRERWIKDKGMTVFSLIDPNTPSRRVDVFVDPPLPFEELWERSVEVQLERSRVRIAAIEDLISMKRAVGRTQDLADIEALEAIKKERHDRG